MTGTMDHTEQTARIGPTERGEPAGQAEEAAAELAAHRPMLFGLAYRMLGSAHDAEDVLQDAYLRWIRVDRPTVAEPRRYLSRMVTRLAVDQLRARQATRETYVGQWLPEPVSTGPVTCEPFDAAAHRDSLSIAMLHLLERLTRPERAVFIMRTAFELPYTEIAETLDRSVPDCRQLYHRATERVGTDQARFTTDRGTQERLLAAFVSATRNGDLAELARMLATDATAWSDGGGKVRSALRPIVGADRVARFFVGIFARNRSELSVEPAEINGLPGIITRYGGSTRALTVAIRDGKIQHVYSITNPDKVLYL